MLTFRNGLRAVCAGFILLCITNSPKAQFYMSGDPDLMKPLYKWSMNQQWNSTLSKWDDTTTIRFSNPDNPDVIFTKIKNEEGKWYLYSKTVYTYQNNKVGNRSNCIYSILLQTNTILSLSEPHILLIKMIILYK